MLFSVSGKLSVAPLAQWAVSRHWDEQHLTQLWPVHCTVHCTVHYLALYNTDCTTGKPLKKNILTSVCCSMFNLNSNVLMMSLPSVDNWMFILTKREVVVRNWSSILNSHNINSYYRCTLNWSAVSAALAGTLPDHHWRIRSCSLTNQIDRFSCKKGSSGFSSRIHFLSSRLPVM